MENNYHRTVFIDIETAGLELEDPIIEAAAVAVESSTYRVIDTLDMKISFEMKYFTNYEALGVNKFSAIEWAKYAIPSDIAAKKLQIFFSRYATVEKISKKTGKPYYIPKLAGHNSNLFDAPRIQHWFDKNGCFFHPQMLRTLDTEQKARWFFEDNPHLKQPENYKLGTLIDHLGIDGHGVPDHSALADSLATVDLGQALAAADRYTATAVAA